MRRLCALRAARPGASWERAARIAAGAGRGRSSHGGGPARPLSSAMSSARPPSRGPAAGSTRSQHRRSRAVAERVRALARERGPDIAALREARFAEGLWCVHCESRQVLRWGRARGRQRYRCKACRRTFSDLTGTPLAYSKLAELWGEYARYMVEAISVREAARRLGINKDTAFRWRHRFLAVLECATHPAPRGIVEVHETRF